MSRLLDKLYTEMQPKEQLMPCYPDYRRMNHELSERLRKWEQSLSAEEKAAWDKIEDLRTRLVDMELKTAHSCGFRLGAGLIMETFADWPSEN